MSGQPTRYAVLADDLTGALDCAAAFISAGFSPYVSLTAEPTGDTASSLVSINMDTRRSDEASAARTAATSTGDVIRAGARPLYVKIDSTMRGHPGTEIEQVAQSSNSRIVFVCPAFPATGRTVKGGRLLVDGVPLTETEVGRDPLSPAATSQVANLLKRHSRLRVIEVPLAQVRSGNWPGLFHRPAMSGSIVLSCDAETEDDLAMIAAAALERDGSLLAGSAGLAAATAARLAAGGTKPSPASTVPVDGPILVVTASRRSLADRQITGLEQAHRLATVPVEFSVSVDGDVTGHRDDGSLATEAFSRGQHVALRVTVSGDLSLLSPAAVREAADHVTAALGNLVEVVTQHQKPAALVIIGGDTALGILTALKTRGIVLHSEPLPGVPVGVISGGTLDGTVIATKAGAFGDETTLVRLFDYLLGQSGRAAQ